MSLCIYRKREEERRREAEQQLSLAGAHHQILLVQVASESFPLAASEPSGKIKDIKPKGHKHRKSSKVHRSQSRDRIEKKKAKEPGELMDTYFSSNIYIELCICKCNHIDV